MPQKNRKDIPLGGDRWISFVEVTDRKEQAVDLCPLMAPLAAFWSILSVHCVACCCNLDAFSFEPEHVLYASASMDADELRRGLSNLLAFVEANHSDVFYCGEFEEYLHRSVLLQLLTHLCACVTTAPA